MLVNHTNAGCNSVTGPVEVNRLSIDEDFSFIGLVKAVEHVHQRRFTRSIFAKKCVNVAFFNCQVDVIICDQRTETFGDPLQFQFHSTAPLLRGRAPVSG